MLVESALGSRRRAGCNKCHKRENILAFQAPHCIHAAISPGRVPSAGLITQIKPAGGSPLPGEL